MPNECNNTLTIVGDETELASFFKKVSDVRLIQDEKVKFSIMENLFPCPEELSGLPANFTKRPEMIEKYGASDWYGWCNSNWGTKWGDYDVSLVHKSNKQVAFSYTTAWSPMTEGLVNISKQFPNLVFVNFFEEGGMGFVGITVIQDGNMLTSIDSEYPSFDVDDDESNYDEAYEKQAEELCTISDRMYEQAILAVPADFQEALREKVGAS